MPRDDTRQRLAAAIAAKRGEEERLPALFEGLQALLFFALRGDRIAQLLACVVAGHLIFAIAKI